jgi:hypothetical protein
VYRSATARPRFGVDEVSHVVTGDLARVEPTIGKRRPLGRTGPTTLALSIGSRVGCVTVDLRKDVVHLAEATDARQSRPGFSPDGVSLEIPGDVFTDVTAPVVFVLVEVDEKFGVTAERVGDVS